MPEEDIAKQIEERLAQLPEDIREAVLASDFDEKVLAIGKAHNLHIDQSQLLGNEIYVVMLGMADMADFVGNVAAQVRVSEEEAEKIATDVGAQIFAPIRESLKKMYEGGGEEAANPLPQNPPEASTKSVVIPSSIAAEKTPVQAQNPVTPAAPISPKPPVPATDMHPAEIVLAEKTIQTAPAAPKPATEAKLEPPKPGIYKADPYREPIE